VKYILFLLPTLLLFIVSLTAQTGGDSNPVHRPLQDTAAIHSPVHHTDSLLRETVRHREQLLPKKIQVDSLRAKRDSSAPVSTLTFRPPQRLSYRSILQFNPWFNFSGNPVNRVEEERNSEGKEELFYFFAGLLFFFAVIKALFGKYLGNLFTLAFRASLKQKQIREQLLQTPLPSLLLNIFFTICAGLYISFLLRYYHFLVHINSWLLLFYCAAGIGLVYTLKFLALKFAGWIFNLREAMNAYIFIVFMLLKILGIFLFPLLVLMAFAGPEWQPALVTLSYLLAGGFFVYRYLIAYAPVRREAKVSGYHFFMYLCAFEIAPLLLIYKVLLKLL
jgi:hypothetical protein